MRRVNNMISRISVLLLFLCAFSLFFSIACSTNDNGTDNNMKAEASSDKTIDNTSAPESPQGITIEDGAPSINSDISVYIVKPIVNQKILPDTVPSSFPLLGEKPKRAISIQACRGEHEPASFVIRAERSLSDIQIESSDLIGSNQGRIPSNAVDIKLVKCWYQAGEGTIRKTGKRVLVPELLLNDDTLVRVDYRQQRNYLKVIIEDKEQYISNSLPSDTIPDNAIIKDADELQKFNLEAETNKQVWLTVHLPKDVVAGDYKGTINLQATGVPSIVIDLTLTVLPFDLQPSPIEYAIYYRGKLPSKPTIGINSEWKTKDQYYAELKDMKEHGILYPTLYQPMDQMLGLALSLRDQVGLPKNCIYVMGARVGNPTKTTELNELSKKIATWKNFISQYGYDDLYVYGIDLASSEKLRSQRVAWQTVKASGAKVFAAGHELFDTVGDILDVPVIGGSYNANELAKFHNKGKKVFKYGRPQVGIEDPDLYRRNYGLGLVIAGYDGAMDYAYQHAFGNIWNDFDHERFRDHVFAYPTSNGVINTIQWEGFREAVDDIRYLATIAALNNGEKKQLLSWLCSDWDEQSDMYKLRSLIINEILKTIKPASS